MAVAPLITAADLGDDAAGEAARLASAGVRGYCGWHVAPSLEETLELDGSRSPLLELPSLLVTAVAEVKVDDVVVTDFEWSRAGMLRRAAGWGAGWRSVQVTFTHGHAETPEDVRLAAIAAARREMVNPDNLRSESGPAYSRVFTIPGTGEAYGAMLTKVEQALLSRYRVPPSP